MEPPRTQSRPSRFALDCFLRDKFCVSSPAEGWFSVLTSDLRKEIWTHIVHDVTFANASSVNRLWHKELTVAWNQFCQHR